MLGTLLMSGALYGLNRLLDPKQKKRSRVYEFDSWESEPDRGGAVPVAYGRNRMSGSVVFRDQAGGDRYDAAVALCEGEIEGVDEDSLKVDDKSMKSDLKTLGSEYQVYAGTPEQAHNEWFEKGAFTLDVLRDAGINSDQPDKEGLNNCLQYQRNKKEQIVFLKFDISSIPDGATITNASIVLTERESSSYFGYAAAQECDNAWSDEVTWNDHPAIGTTRTTYAFHDSGSGPTDPADTITDSSGNFLNDGFVEGMYVTVFGSANNDSVYKISSLTADTMTLRQVDYLTDEAAGASVQIAPSSKMLGGGMKLNMPVYEVVNVRHAEGADYVSFAVRGIQHPAYPAYSTSIDMEYSSMELGTQPPKLYVEYSYANPSAYRHLAYIALRLKASERLSGGSEHTVTAVVDGLKVRQWDDVGEVWVTAFSRNPAWITLDILTNGRWPASIADSWIDLESFKTAAAYWVGDVTLSDGTKEPRVLCDIVFDTQTSKASAIEQVLQTCGGWLVRRQGKIALVPEKAETVSHTFDMSNIALTGSEYDAQSSFSYNEIAWTNRPNRVEVEFINAANDFEKGYETWEDEDDQDARCLIPLTLQVYGITRRSQASRMARLILGKYDLHRYQARLSGGIASTGVVAGDVVSVTHPVAGWTAREFRVIGTSEKFNDEISLVLEEYNASLYNDTGKPYTPPQEPVFESPERIPPDVTDLVLTETYKTLDDGTYLPLVKISFTPPVNLARPLNYLIFWRKGADPWVPVPQIEHYDDTAVTWYLEAMETGTYTVKVQAIDIYSGVRSAFPEEATITVLGKTTVPTAPGAPTLAAIAGGLVIDWVAVTDGDVKGYNVYIDTASPATTFTAFVQATSWMFRGLGNQLYHVRITAVNSAGESAFSPEASGTTLAEGDFQVDDIDVPMPSGIEWSTNSRAEWTGGQIVYRGTIYNIVGGNTTLKYIYWAADSANTQLQASATEPTLGANAWVLAIYDSASDTLDLAFMGKIINGALFKAASIHGNKLMLTSINTSELTHDAGWTQGATWGVDISNRPTSLSGINSGEGNKLSGIEAGADVTGSHTAKDIVNLPDTPSVPGLYADGSKLGFHDGSDWMVYIENSSGQGRFYFKGDASNFLTWDGSELTVRGKFVADDIQSGGTITGNSFQTAPDGNARVDVERDTNSIFFIDENGSVYMHIGGGYNTGTPYSGINFPDGRGLIQFGAGKVVYLTVAYNGITLDRGGTITCDGDITCNSNVICAAPTSAGHAATKQYVDDNAGGVTDHGELDGLGDDDHPGYLNATRHAAIGSNPHGVTYSDAGAAPSANGVTNGNSHNHSGGDGAQIDHGSLSGRSDDDHTQYLNNARHAAIGNNPHGVTHTQVGAAASAHTHGSGDITGGASGAIKYVYAVGAHPSTGRPAYGTRTITVTNGIITSIGTVGTWYEY